MAKKPTTLDVIQEEGDDETGLTSESNIALNEAQHAAQDAPTVIRVQKPGEFVPERPKVIPRPATIKRVTIILEESDAIPPTGLFIQPNGHPYLLLPGVEADVPLEVISVLNDAITSAPVMDPVTRQVRGFRDRLRFPYRVVHRPLAA